MAKLSTSLNDALNQQIVKEYQNELIYRQIQSYFESTMLMNLAHYFKKQADDENSHAQKFIDYINSRSGGRVVLGTVDVPDLNLSDFASVGDKYVFVEETTTTSIEELYDLALSEKSYIDLGFLQCMLHEQVSEEKEAMELSAGIKLVKDIVLFDLALGEG